MRWCWIANLFLCAVWTLLSYYDNSLIFQNRNRKYSNPKKRKQHMFLKTINHVYNIINTKKTLLKHMTLYFYLIIVQ